ncbi:hypothetical protein [Bacillus sp. 2205SS5-2]
MKQEQERIVYPNERIYTYPLAGEFNIVHRYEFAFQQIERSPESESR